MSMEPRIWVGDSISIEHWYWAILDNEKYWNSMSSNYALMPGNIFVPRSEPKPTIDPSKMKTIATCDKVDWSNT